VLLELVWCVLSSAVSALAAALQTEFIEYVDGQRECQEEFNDGGSNVWCIDATGSSWAINLALSFGVSEFDHVEGEDDVSHSGINEEDEAEDVSNGTVCEWDQTQESSSDGNTTEGISQSGVSVWPSFSLVHVNSTDATSIGNWCGFSINFGINSCKSYLIVIQMEEDDEDGKNDD